MSDKTTSAAGETRLPDPPPEPEIRLRGEDEAGQGTGFRDLGGLGIAVCLFALALLIYSDATSYPIRRSYAQFGPEIFAFLSAAGIGGVAVLTTFMGLRGQFEQRSQLNVGGLLWIVGAIVTQIALLYSGAGFIVASTILFAFAARAFGQTTHVLNLTIGVVMSSLLFLLFRYGLGLALPNGPLERTIDLLLR